MAHCQVQHDAADPGFYQRFLDAFSAATRALRVICCIHISHSPTHSTNNSLSGHILNAIIYLLFANRVNDKHSKPSSLLTPRVRAVQVGDPMAAQTNLGPVVSADHRAKIESYIDLARQAGGTLIAGDHLPEDADRDARGFYVQPTIVTGLPHDSR